MRGLASLGVVVIAASTCTGQVIDPFFAGSYSYTDLGAPVGVPSPFGGLTLLDGSRDHLILGGSANSPSGALYLVPVSRDAFGHIDGFAGDAVYFADAPYNDGGVTYGPDGVLFASRWPVNELGQYLPGSTAPDKVIDLTALGVAGSHSAINFVPLGYSGAGRMKLSSWSGGQFYDAEYAPDGLGTFDVLSATQTATLPGGPEGFAYVPPGSPLFTGPTLIVSEFSAGNVSVYDVDGAGDPIDGTRRDFMTGLGGAEGAYIDPYTGDFLFSTFGGGDRVIVVTGFVQPPCPADVDQDGFISGDDFTLFVEWFEVGDIRADFNRDGFVTGDDFTRFVLAFEAGC